MTRLASSDNRLWFGLDQGLSSATNFAGAALTAGLLTELDYGGWAIAYATFIVVLTTIRSFAGDAALIVLPGADNQVAPSLISGAASTALLSAIVAGALVAAGSFLVGGATSSALVALAICLPGLILQDSLRFSLLAVGRASAACANDGLWLVLSVTALMVLRLTDTASATLAMFAWAGSAVPAALLGLWQGRVRLGTFTTIIWLRSTRSLSGKLLGAHMCYLAASMTMVSVVVGLASGAQPVGAIRATQTLFGPVTVLFAGASLYTQPQLVRRLASGLPIRRPAVQLASVGVAITAICAAILWWTPSTIGTRVFGNSWSSAHDLIPAMACIMAVGAVATGAIVALRANRSVSSILMVNLATAAIQIPAMWWLARHVALATLLMAYAVISGPAAGALWYLVTCERAKLSQVHRVSP